MKRRDFIVSSLALAGLTAVAPSARGTAPGSYMKYSDLPRRARDRMESRKTQWDEGGYVMVYENQLDENGYVKGSIAVQQTRVHGSSNRTAYFYPADPSFDEVKALITTSHDIARAALH